MDQNQDKMPETRLNEALSALMDGEVDELELRRILRELPAKPELYAAWRRYHAVQASLHQEVHLRPSVDLLAGVQVRLAAEQESGPQGTFGGMLRSRMIRYIGQGAIAASVAATALMGVSLLEVADNDTGAMAPVIADAGTSPLVNGEFNAEAQTRTVSFDAEARNRLQRAVYRELSGVSEEIPVSYTAQTPELPVIPTPAE